VGSSLIERDIEIYKAWIAGERQRSIGARLGITQQSVSEAVARARNVYPIEDRAETLSQSVEIASSMLEVFLPKALEGDKGAARIVDRFIGRRADLLGLTNPKKIELAAAVQEVREGVEPLSVVLDRILARQVEAS
jgi:DNA-binding CsgD family transcriptional regulator